MPHVAALSTGFAHSAGLGPAEIVDVLLRADAGGVVLDAALDPGRLEGLERDLLRRAEELPVLAVEAPCPAGRYSSAELCSPDKDEAQVALEAVEATIRRAGALGARFVALRLGRVAMLDKEWAFARDKFLRADLEERLVRKLADAREDAGGRSLDAARRAIERLARAAEHAGLQLVVRNGRRFVDVPSPRELGFLLADCAGAPLGSLFDLAAAHLPELMGFHSLAHTAEAFGKPALLAYVGDACGPVGSLAPGRGMLDVAALAKSLPASCAIAFSGWAGLTVAETVAALPAVDRATGS